MRHQSYNQLNQLPLAPLTVLVPAKSSVESKTIALQEQIEMKFANDIEMIHYLTHEVNNVQHANGRINMRIDKNGQLYANSVSPYSKSYLDNIEEKIKPLVQAFHNKRYLMYSSCEGHGLSFRRYIGLAFGDEETRQYVADEIMKLKLPGVFFKYMDSVANQKLDKNVKGLPLLNGIYSKNEKENLEFIRKEVFTFNIQFHRNYEKFYFLELVILKEINFDIKKPHLLFQQLWITYLKKYKWDKITNRIVNLVNSKNFKKYPY